MTRYHGSTHDFVSFAYRIDDLPARGVKRRKVFETLIKSCESGKGTLPRGWAVTWMWRNREDGQLREDTFQNTVRNSRAQFLMLMGRRLRRDMRSLGYPEPEVTEIREATEREVALLERDREPFEEVNEEREIQRKKEARKHAKKAKRKAKKPSKRKSPKRH